MRFSSRIFKKIGLVNFALLNRISVFWEAKTKQTSI